MPGVPSSPVFSRSSSILAPSLPALHALPALEDAWRILLAARHSVRKTRHSLAVALVGLRLGEALRKRGHNADLSLIAGAGLLHDICHGKREHAMEGSLLLQRQGWSDAAYVVGCHTVLPPMVLDWLGVAERDYGYKQAALPALSQSMMEPTYLASVCIYLADKYCLGDRAVSIAERFENIRTYCRAIGIREGMEDRQAVAIAVEDWIARACDASPLDLALRPCGNTQEERLRAMVAGLHHALANPHYLPKISSKS